MSVLVVIDETLESLEDMINYIIDSINNKLGR